MDLVIQEIEFDEVGNIISIIGGSSEENKDLKISIEHMAELYKYIPKDYLNSHEFQNSCDTLERFKNRIKGHPKELETLRKLLINQY